MWKKWLKTNKCEIFWKFSFRVCVILLNVLLCYVIKLIMLYNNNVNSSCKN